eukprot:g6196.t1
MTEFEDASFSVRDWINDACRKKPAGEALDKYLTQLETKLQLKCEDVEKEIETCAVQLAREIPHVLTSTAQIKNEVFQLQSTVSDTAAKLKTRSLAAQSVIGGIKEIHHIKSNMQSACSSLKEAAELSELFVRVDAVFNTGDIFAMAKIMTTIHHSLKFVGNVPEFESGKRKIKALEETLISSIKSQLLPAISQRQDEAVVKLCDTLVSLNAFSTMKESFVSVKRKELDPEIKHLLDFLSDPLANEISVRESVREWYHLILRKLNEEFEWCVRLFPTHGLNLLVSFLIDTIGRLNHSLEEALVKLASIEGTISVQKTTFEFLLAINEILPSSLQNDAIKKLTLEPIEKQVETSVQIERSNLNRILNQLDLASPGGVQLIKLATEMEFCLTKFVSILTSSLREIRTGVLPAKMETFVDEGNNISILQLLKIGLDLIELLSSFQEKLRVTSIKVLVELSHDRDGLDVYTIAQERLMASDRTPMSEFLRQLKEQDWIQLDGVHKAIDGFRASVEALVFDIFMHKPRSLFKGFGSMTEWSKTTQGDSQDSITLPQFSTYPLQYITSLGEYLMMVPQQLESMVSTDLNLDDDRLEKEEEMASFLLTKIINGATELCADEILGIPYLSSLGAAQLNCDLQYFSNVLSAMGSTFSSPLASVHEAVKTPNDELRRRIQDGKMESNQLFIFKSIEKIKTSK